VDTRVVPGCPVVETGRSSRTPEERESKPLGGGKDRRLAVKEQARLLRTRRPPHRGNGSFLCFFELKADGRRTTKPSKKSQPLQVFCQQLLRQQDFGGRGGCLLLSNNGFKPEGGPKSNGLLQKAIAILLRKTIRCGRDTLSFDRLQLSMRLYLGRGFVR
jgi:hypothetical protein